MNISFSDFQKLDIRVGTIVKAAIPEGSEKLVRLEVDCGEEIGKRLIFAGIKEFYSVDDLIDKQIVVIVNLEPKKFMGEVGEGMLLAANHEEKPVIITPETSVNNGTKIR